MRDQLKEIQSLYQQGGNIIQFLKNKQGVHRNNPQMIMISYDFQAGSYTQHAKEHAAFQLERCSVYAKLLNALTPCGSLLEAGVGEATSLSLITKSLKHPLQFCGGFDIAYSRVLYALANMKAAGFPQAQMFTGDIFHAPLCDNSIDLVYTVHALEPNGGHEEEALKELYRIARKYLVLIEPSYEWADASTRAFMDQHGYIKGLPDIAKKLGYRVLDNRLLFSDDPISQNKNNTSVLIIAKDEGLSPSKHPSWPFACPITKAPLKEHGGALFSAESLLAYPIVAGIPCVLPENAIVATHFLDPINEVA